MGKNARTYWEMFGGVNEVGQPDRYVRSLDLDVDVGGYYAFEYPYYQMRIYGRASIEGENLDTLYSQDIVAPGTIEYDVVGITSSSVDNPTTITTSSPHGMGTSGSASVEIAGHTSTPDINGNHTATLTGESTFTISQSVTVEGSGGTATFPHYATYWTPLEVRVSVMIGIDDPEEHLVRCLVVKVERKDGTYDSPATPGPTKRYRDQYGVPDESDPPAWGIRIHKAKVYASGLGRDVRPHLMLEDILDNSGFTYSGPTVNWVVDQMAFVDIPMDRQEALDAVNGLLGWNYACWDGTEVKFALSKDCVGWSLPAGNNAWTIAADDPRTSWSVTESLDETYNAVRVCYANKRGKLREVVVHGDESAIGFTRADTLQAPESVKSADAATRFGKRYLRSHEKRQVMGTLTIQGYDGVTEPDPLLIRPGDTITMTGPAPFLSGAHEVTSVTLNPLDWSASVQFGTNSKRFDTWLARLAAGAKSIKRR